MVWTFRILGLTMNLILGVFFMGVNVLMTVVDVHAYISKGPLRALQQLFVIRAFDSYVTSVFQIIFLLMMNLHILVSVFSGLRVFQDICPFAEVRPVAAIAPRHQSTEVRCASSCQDSPLEGPEDPDGKLCRHPHRPHPLHAGDSQVPGHNIQPCVRRDCHQQFSRPPGTGASQISWMAGDHLHGDAGSGPPPACRGGGSPGSGYLGGSLRQGRPCSRVSWHLHISLFDLSWTCALMRCVARCSTVPST